MKYMLCLGRLKSCYLGIWMHDVRCFLNHSIFSLLSTFLSISISLLLSFAPFLSHTQYNVILIIFYCSFSVLIDLQNTKITYTHAAHAQNYGPLEYHLLVSVQLETQKVKFLMLRYHTFYHIYIGTLLQCSQGIRSLENECLYIKWPYLIEIYVTGQKMCCLGLRLCFLITILWLSRRTIWYTVWCRQLRPFGNINIFSKAVQSTLSSVFVSDAVF